MKIILPLAALAILSTLFLISRTVDPTQQPLVQIDLEQRAHEQGVTRPSFSGVTSGGDQVTLNAEKARPDPQDAERLIAEKIMTELRLNHGTVVTISARNADMHQSRYTASLGGDVQIETTNGYRLTTNHLNARFDTLFVETPGLVEGSTPIGTIRANRMLITGNEDAGDAEMLFTGGVKLVYTPNSSEE